VRIQKRAASSIIARGEAPPPDLLKLDVLFVNTAPSGGI